MGLPLVHRAGRWEVSRVKDGGGGGGGEGGKMHQQIFAIKNIYYLSHVGDYFIQSKL